VRPKGAHHGEETLALFAGNDLPLLERWRVAAHLRGCPGCSDLVEQYRRLRAETAEMADGIDAGQWAHLESEMRANIRLGLAAGAALDAGARTAAPSPFSWRWAAVAASMVFVFGAGLWLERRSDVPSPVQTASLEQPVVEAGNEGLALRNTDASLELIRPRGSAAVRTVSWDGSAGARYFDGETGQVTIHQVAWEDSDAR
jgi:hypothetical protein